MLLTVPDRPRAAFPPHCVSFAVADIDAAGVAVTGWLVDVTGTYSAAFVLTAMVSAAGALMFGFLFDARPIATDRLAAPAPLRG